jgi:uncharacterized protein YdhG (YjbR/CyaY superfamily)
MAPNKTIFTNVDEYIASFPKETQKILEQIRAAVQIAAPEAVETIKYQMPTFTLNGNLIHFGAFSKHIGIYPAPKGDDAFRKELSVYKSMKSTIKIPLDKPMPLELITRIVKLRIKETGERAKAK